MEKTIRASRLVRVVAVGALAASLGLGAVSSAHASSRLTHLAADSQGAVKLEVGGQDFEVDGTDNNEPKAPCVNNQITFNVIGDGFKANTSATVTVEPQGGGPPGSPVYNNTVTTLSDGSFTILSITLAGGQDYKVEVTGTNGDMSGSAFDKQKVIHSGNCTTTSPPGGGGNPTPELGSGELLATGLLPIGAILLYRRRRNRRAS